jgi:hypothetical protein
VKRRSTDVVVPLREGYPSLARSPIARFAYGYLWIGNNVVGGGKLMDGKCYATLQGRELGKLARAIVAHLDKRAAAARARRRRGRKGSP